MSDRYWTGGYDSEGREHGEGEYVIRNWSYFKGSYRHGKRWNGKFYMVNGKGKLKYFSFYVLGTEHDPPIKAIFGIGEIILGSLKDLFFDDSPSSSSSTAVSSSCKKCCRNCISYTSSGHFGPYGGCYDLNKKIWYGIYDKPENSYCDRFIPKKR